VKTRGFFFYILPENLPEMINPSLYDQISPSEAVAYQKELREKLQLRPLKKNIRTIGGSDISFNKFADIVYAGIIVLSYPDLEEIEKITIISTAKFPYVPGLLAFREIPALLEAWNQLAEKPDVLVCDGHGIAHPRRLGIASHFGILTNTPTIGCGKSRLTGFFEEPGSEPFSKSLLLDKGETIGVVLRTKKNCKPVFISPGNNITINESIDIITRCVGKYRIPEPTRKAHLLVNEARVRHRNEKA